MCRQCKKYLVHTVEYSQTKQNSANVTFNFDYIFGPKNTQQQVYERVAKPIVEGD
jgi:ribosomal protein L44E